MSLTSSTVFITSNDQLQAYLNQCTECRLLTDNATNIISQEVFKNLKLSSFKQSKLSFIVFTLQDESTNIGHWVAITIYRNQKIAVFYDPANSNNSYNTLILEHVRTFCSLHGLTLKVFPLKTQPLCSFACGYHILYFLHLSHKLTLKDMLNFKARFSNYSLKSIELYILRTVLKRLRPIPL
jgi:hypothetical protein